MRAIQCIDFENHYTPPALLEVLSQRTTPPYFNQEECRMHMNNDPTSGVPISEALTNLSLRLEDMDRTGVNAAVISGPPMPETLSAEGLTEPARVVNNSLYADTSRHPDRFKAFACLPVYDTEAAVKELQRCRERGFVGWHTHSNYGSHSIDEERFFPILKTAADNNMFVYLHPTHSGYERLYGCGSAVASAGLGYTVDAAITIIRMIALGIFDRLPNLKVLLGHIGEGIPFYLHRLDCHAADTSIGEQGKNEQPFSYYFKKNIWVTMSGNYSKEAFMCAKEVLGIERMLFASDYPFESLDTAMEHMKNLCMTQIEREMLFEENAKKFLQLEF